MGVIARLLKKITYGAIQLIVGIMLVVIGLGKATGLLLGAKHKAAEQTP